MVENVHESHYVQEVCLVDHWIYEHSEKTRVKQVKEFLKLVKHLQASLLITKKRKGDKIYKNWLDTPTKNQGRREKLLLKS